MQKKSRVDSVDVNRLVALNIMDVKVVIVNTIAEHFKRGVNNYGAVTVCVSNTLLSQGVSKPYVREVTSRIVDTLRQFEIYDTRNEKVADVELEAPRYGALGDVLVRYKLTH